MTFRNECEFFLEMSPIVFLVNFTDVIATNGSFVRWTNWATVFQIYFLLTTHRKKCIEINKPYSSEVYQRFIYVHSSFSIMGELPLISGLFLGRCLSSFIIYKVTVCKHTPGKCHDGPKNLAPVVSNHVHRALHYVRYRFQIKLLLILKHRKLYIHLFYKILQ